MDTFDELMRKYDEEREKERLAFLSKCASKITDNELVYGMCALKIMQRFGLELRWDKEPPYVCYKILDYYVENVDKDFQAWLYGDDAPMIRHKYELRKIFPELVLNENITDEEIVNLANEIYGVELNIYDDEFIYSFGFNFNDFVPIPAKEIHDIKKEIATLIKYDVDTSVLEDKLKSYNLPEKVIRSL